MQTGCARVQFPPLEPHTKPGNACIFHRIAKKKRKKKRCDEFPFQSTKEGAANGDKKYSARVLDKKQN